MKLLVLFIGCVFILIAVLAAPIAIGFGLYDWVGNDAEFKFALWDAFKMWVMMVVAGISVGLPCCYWAK